MKHSIVKFLCSILFVFSIQYLYAQSKDDSNQSESFRYAIEIANWLQDNTNNNVWPDVLDDPEKISLSYSDGVTGKIIYFLELYYATKNDSYLKTAEAAGEYVLYNLPQKTDSLKGKFWAFSPYGNVCGSGFALTELFKATNNEVYKKGAVSIFEVVKHFADESSDSISWDLGNDVLGGLSGTGLYLLYTAKELQLPEAKHMALKAGNTLLARAIKTDSTLNWKRGQNSQYILPNFSHGAAGIGYFMARLYEETNDMVYLDAALKANNYLESIAKTDDGVFLLPYGFPDPGWSRPFDIGWAHGPAGVIRFYRQLNNIQPDSKWTQRITQCIKGIKISNIPNVPAEEFGGEQFETDMRFGLAGVVDALLDESRAGGGKEFQTLIDSNLKYILDKSTKVQDNRFWHQERLAFMQGAGDITSFTGYFYGAVGYGLMFLNNHYLQYSTEPRIRFVDNPY